MLYGEHGTWRRGKSVNRRRREGGFGRTAGVCSLDDWRSLIASRPASNQLSLEKCGPVSDGSTWREALAARGLTLLPRALADASVRRFEESACLKRSGLPPSSPESFAANEAYMRDVHLTPADMHECRSDPAIM